MLYSAVVVPRKWAAEVLMHFEDILDTFSVPKLDRKDYFSINSMFSLSLTNVLNS